MNSLGLKFNKIYSDNFTNVLNKLYEYKMSAHSKIAPVLAKWSEAMPSWKPSTSSHGPDSSISRKNPTSHFPKALPLFGALTVLGIAALYLKPGSLSSQGAKTNLLPNPLNNTMKDDLSLLDPHLQTASLSVDIFPSTVGFYPELMSPKESNVSTLFGSAECQSTSVFLDSPLKTARGNGSSTSNFSLPSKTASSLDVSLKPSPATAEENELGLSKLSLPAERLRSSDEDFLESLALNGAGLSFDAYSKADQSLGRFVDTLDPAFEKTDQLFEPVVATLGSAIEKPDQVFELVVDTLSLAVEKTKEFAAPVIDTIDSSIANHPGIGIGSAFGISTGMLTALWNFDLANRAFALKNEIIAIESLITKGQISRAIEIAVGTMTPKSNFVRTNRAIVLINEIVKANLVTIPLCTGIGFAVEKVARIVRCLLGNADLSLLPIIFLVIGGGAYWLPTQYSPNYDRARRMNQAATL